MQRNLSKSDFEAFLDLLDADRENAADKYLGLRRKIESFFEWRGCDFPEDLTDVVFDRVTNKISEGEKIENVEAYCVSIAKFVVLEDRRKSLKHIDLETVSAVAEVEADCDEFDEEKLICLRKCLAGLPVSQRELLIEYFEPDDQTLIPKRQNLASKLNVNLNVLRIRVSRLKSKLEKCTRDCFEKK